MGGGCGHARSDGFFWPHCNCGVKLLCMRLCVRNLRVFWNAWLRIAVGMAASKFLARAAVFVILLFYAAESCESYWSGCIKVAIMLSQISPFLGL